MINEIIAEYDEQLDLRMSMIQERSHDLLIRKKELQKLLSKLCIQ